MLGSGAILRSVEVGAATTALIVGKPSLVLIEHIKDRFSIDPTTTVMIGDRLDTDVLFANRGGIDSCLVLSGCTTLAELSSLPSNDPREPRHVMAALRDAVL